MDFRRHKSAYLRLGFAASLFIFAWGSSGCLSERSFPFDKAKIGRLSEVKETESARQWLKRAHHTFKHKLPDEDETSLLTEDMTTPEGKPAAVLAHFDREEEKLHSVWHNLAGLKHTAQVTGDTEAIDQPAPAWEGFEDLWIPVADGVTISGRVGLVRDGAGNPKRANCVVILPGLLGDNMRVRTRDIAIGLRNAGFHTLAMELRGHGQTEGRFPELHYNFGVLETADLLKVDEWLHEKPYVDKTGLIGFSWSANSALLVAWEDGRAEDDPLVAPALRQYLKQTNRKARHYEAGVIALSPCLRFENLCDALESQ